MQEEPQNQPNKNSVEDLPVNLSQLILGFSSAALHHLVEQQADQQSKQRLSLARHNIAILDLLMDKTKGNLDKEEEKLLQEVLTDLKMKYVSAAKNLGNPINPQA